MNQIQRIVEFFSIPEGRPELVVAQMRALARKVPLMYTIIIIGVIGLAYTHLPHAPIWLTVYLPAAIVAISSIRLITYWNVGRTEFTPEEARQRLKTAVLMSMALSICFVSWALSLSHYGTPYTQGQIIFLIGGTAFGNAASVMHVRPALAAMFFGMIAPLLIFLALSGNIVHIATAITVLGVSVAIAAVLLDSSLDFEKLIESSLSLEKERIAAHELSVANFELATIDPLTGLRNRRGFFQALEEAIADDEQGHAIGIGLLDIDGFKPINDIYGHPAGDQVLQEVGRRLGALGSDVIAGRLGGDEFGLIFVGCGDEDELHARGEMICERMRIPFRMDAFSAQMSASVGLTASCPECHNAEKLIKRADHALYYAKRHASGSVVLFSQEHAEEIRRSLGVERRLRDANLDEEISLAYQMVYDAATDTVTGVEALARWENPVVGVVPPDVFIRSAERSGQIGRLTEILFTKLLRETADWPDHVFVSFNLSAHDVCAPERILKLISIADRNGIAPGRLTFEITETAVMHDFERAQESLNLLKRFGARIALDDFGTGQSSLSYVHTLPLDRVKVDRSFVAEIEHNPVTQAVVRTILDLCKHLELDCIIEGVETKGQLDTLQAMGCSAFQGYLFSRPLDGVAMRRYLVADQNRRRSGEMRA